MRKGGLEPPRGHPHYHLKVARIPIPPLPQSVIEELDSSIHINIYATEIMREKFGKINQGFFDRVKQEGHTR